MILSLDETMARTILSSEFLLRKLRPLSALELALSETFPDFKLGRDNPVLSTLSDNFTLTLNNFGAGKAPAKAVYDNLFTRIKLDRHFLQQTLKRASFSAILKAVTHQIGDHCRQFIVQGVDDLTTLEKWRLFLFRSSGRAVSTGAGKSADDINRAAERFFRRPVLRKPPVFPASRAT